MDRKLLELLVCPVTKGALAYDRERQLLISTSAKLAYPIRDGIPVLLESAATPLADLPPPAPEGVQPLRIADASAAPAPGPQAP